MQGRIRNETVYANQALFGEAVLYYPFQCQWIIGALSLPDSSETTYNMTTEIHLFSWMIQLNCYRLKWLF